MGAAGLWSGILRSPSGRSNGAEETGREGWTDGLTGLSRDGSLARIAVRCSRQRMLPGTNPPAQSVADLFRHCLRQQPERLPPGCPEGFSVLTQSTDRSVSEDRTEAAVLKGLKE